MIVKIVKRRHRTARPERPYRARISYVVGKAKYVEYGNLSESIDLADRQMRIAWRLNARVSDPCSHLVVCFNALDAPSEKDILAACHALLQRIGATDLQYVLAIHRDRPNIHVHIILNRIHPVSGRALSTSQSYLKFEQACREIEYEMGFPADRGRFRPTIENGRVVLLPHPAEHWQRKRDRRAAGRHRGSDLARQIERRTATRCLHNSLPVEVFAKLRDLIDRAESWNALHQGLARVGLTYELSGRGARICRGKERMMPASALGSMYSLPQLIARLGAFQSAPFQEQGQSTQPSHDAQTSEEKTSQDAGLNPTLQHIRESFETQRNLWKEESVRRRTARRNLHQRQETEQRRLKSRLEGKRDIMSQALRQALKMHHRDERNAWRIAATQHERPNAYTHRDRLASPGELLVWSYGSTLYDALLLQTNLADHTDCRHRLVLDQLAPHAPTSREAEDRGDREAPRAPRTAGQREFPNILALRRDELHICGFLCQYRSGLEAIAEGGWPGIARFGERDSDRCVVTDSIAAALRHRELHIGAPVSYMLIPAPIPQTSRPQVVAYMLECLEGKIAEIAPGIRPDIADLVAKTGIEAVLMTHVDVEPTASAHLPESRVEEAIAEPLPETATEEPEAEELEDIDDGLSFPDPSPF